MERKRIVAKIEKVKQGIEDDAEELLLKKILQREFHFQRSGRGFLSARLIDRLRRRLIVEMNHILEPILDNQKEINLRLLKEIQKLKKSHERPSSTHSRARAPKNKKTAGKN